MTAVVLSNSRRGSVTGCKYRFFLEQILGLRREQVAAPLRLGTLWHEYMRRGLMTADWSWAQEVLEDPEIQQDEEVGPLVLGMARTAAPKIQDFMRDYDVEALEVPFFLRITRSPRNPLGFKVQLVERPTPETLQQERGFVLYYSGQMDAILRDKVTRHLWVWEHKTTSTSEQSKFERDMEASFQVYGYMLAAQAMYPLDEVCGVLFDAARKKLPGTPKLNQCKWCKGTGEQMAKVKDAGVTVQISQICEVCEGSGKGQFSSSVIETTADMLDEALENAPHLRKEQYAEWRDGAYREWRAECLRTSRPFWFVYHKAVRWEQIKAWLEDTWQVARQYNAMKKAKEEREFCRHLDSMQCGRCAMRPLCLDGTDWDRSSAPIGFVQVDVPEIPAEVGQHGAQEETPAPEDDFIGF